MCDLRTSRPSGVQALKGSAFSSSTFKLLLLPLWGLRGSSGGYSAVGWLCTGASVSHFAGSGYQRCSAACCCAVAQLYSFRKIVALPGDAAPNVLASELASLCKRLVAALLREGTCTVSDCSSAELQANTLQSEVHLPSDAQVSFAPIRSIL